MRSRKRNKAALLACLLLLLVCLGSLTACTKEGALESLRPVPLPQGADFSMEELTGSWGMVDRQGNNGNLPCDGYYNVCDVNINSDGELLFRFSEDATDITFPVENVYYTSCEEKGQLRMVPQQLQDYYYLFDYFTKGFVVQYIDNYSLALFSCDIDYGIVDENGYLYLVFNHDQNEVQKNLLYVPDYIKFEKTNDEPMEFPHITTEDELRTKTEGLQKSIGQSADVAGQLVEACPLELSVVTYANQGSEDAGYSVEDYIETLQFGTALLYQDTAFAIVDPMVHPFLLNERRIDISADSWGKGSHEVNIVQNPHNSFVLVHSVDWESDSQEPNIPQVIIDAFLELK